MPGNFGGPLKYKTPKKSYLVRSLAQTINGKQWLTGKMSVLSTSLWIGGLHMTCKTLEFERNPEILEKKLCIHSEPKSTFFCLALKLSLQRRWSSVTKYI